MAATNIIDINENMLVNLDKGLFEILLKDRTTGANLIWATGDYVALGPGFKAADHIAIRAVTGPHGDIIRPRVAKSSEQKWQRARDKAEVFTPAWICNKQNNLVDNAWFGRENIFNKESTSGWETLATPVLFPGGDGRTWEDYVISTRLEITCGEAPYLISRYDAVSGEYIAREERIGLLDRKLRIVRENVTSQKDWLIWAEKALESIYGFDYQGDNVLLSRENIFWSMREEFCALWGEEPTVEQMRRWGEIISWNIWQMDGLKFVVPESCQTKEVVVEDLFEKQVVKKECEGCKKNAPFKHNGIYCRIKNWRSGRESRFVDSLKGEKNGRK